MRTLHITLVRPALILSLAIGAVTANSEEKTPYSTLPEIIVKGQAIPEVKSSELILQQPKQGIPADASELLRQMTGISGTRMGGHGIDPIVRGQSQNQLNILMDGAYIHSGCPNRMDPPTAYSSLESYDQITLIKGSQTVIYGGGGSGGTILFERQAPTFKQGEHVKANVVSGYKSNSETKDASADLAVGNSQGYLRLIGGYKDANNYEDGDGNETRSAYRTISGNLIIGWTPNNDQHLQLNLETNREKDLLYAGAGMDSPESEADTVRFKYQQEAMDGLFSTIKLQAYNSEVDHLMDNYSLRELTAAMKMAAPTKSETLGGRLQGEMDLGNQQLIIGIDYQRNQRNANRFSGPATGGDPETLQSILWPDAELEQTGLYAEWLLPSKTNGQWEAGLRYDRVDASIARGNVEPDVGMSPTPNALYARYYDKTSDSADESNVSGFIQYQKKLGKGTVHSTLSRSVRTADATERYIASFSVNMMTSIDNSWVGNPELDPEKHHQLEVGYRFAEKKWSSSFDIYYNRVSDFILRDKARAQSGILVDNGTTTVYRNITAKLYGAELEGKYHFNSSLSGNAGISYVERENTTNDRPIAQTPPLELSVGLDYSHDAWQTGASLKVNDKQHRVDIEAGSGQDIQETPGWAVLNLYSRYRINTWSQVELGVDNVFDRTYAYHVNRANVDPFNSEPVQVNEPGRVIWSKASIKF